MTGVLKSERKSLEEINGLLDSAFVEGEGITAVVESPAAWAPSTVGNIYANPGPMAGQSEVASLIKINNVLSNIVSTDGEIQAIFTP